MCGLSGIVNGSVDVMIAQQSHRGHDHTGKLIYQNVSFGHNRLSILDLSEAGNQPFESDRWICVANCEIYNYKELEGKGNDAARIIPTVEKYGIEGLLSRIRGMFAISLYDKVEKKIHLIVDRFAEKPLYYYSSGETFAFASSPSALLHLKEKWAINSEGLKTYWALGSVMGSIWQGIKKVNGSEWVTVDLQAKKITSQVYWKPSYSPLSSKDLMDLILDSIRGVKSADVPVYIFLSGGIDSSVVSSQCAGMNAIHLDGPERPYAERVAKRFGLDLHIVSPKKTSATEAFTDYAMKSGEPSMAGIIPWIVSREASTLCKVAITANGADEIFFGYSRTQNEVTQKQVEHIFRRTPCDVTIEAPEDSRISTGRWFELKTYIECDLNKSLDFASMCHSLEVRSPFLDHRLVEAALSLPQKDCGKKDHLKNILKAYGFGSDFLNRPKKGFSLYHEPEGYTELQESSFKWAIEEGFLTDGNFSTRDKLYLKASAAGFKCWYDYWKPKIC